MRFGAACAGEMRHVGRGNSDRCFVLRILTGLSSRVCAQLLRLDRHTIEQATSRACRLLPSPVRSNVYVSMDQSHLEVSCLFAPSNAS